jgi:hypothetical protein
MTRSPLIPAPFRRPEPDLPIGQISRFASALYSPTQLKVLSLLQMKSEVFGAREMSRLSFVLLIVTGLALTAYFGAAAWRLSDESHLDVTGHIRPPAN